MEEEKKKTEEEKGSRIRIMSINDKRKEFANRYKHMASYLLIIFISVILSLLIFRIFYYNRDISTKKNDPSIPTELTGAFHNSDELRKLYEGKLKLALGVALSPDDFKFNDASRVTNGILIDNNGNIIIPSRILNNISNKVYIRVSNEAKDIYHEGTILGVDQFTKMALINAPTLKNLNPQFAGFENVNLGDFLAVVASPFGDNESANLRIASVFTKNLNYTIIDDQSNESKVSAVLASFMVINANDGGMVIDQQGKLLGMASQHISEKLKLGNNSAVLTKGEMDKIRDRILAKEKESTIDLGVEGKLIKFEINGSEKPVFYVRTTKPKTTAQLGGILPLDMIISFDGKPITEDFIISKALMGKKVGETVTVEILRTGEIKRLIMKIY